MRTEDGSAIQQAGDLIKPAAASVVLEDIHFEYRKGEPVLAGIDAAVEPGTMLGVVGPSGCGKSTLLALISGLARPTSGRVECAWLEGSSRHPLSMVFQKDTLLPWLTVANNVKYFSKFRASRRQRSERPDLDERVAELLELTQLSDYADHYPYQLSGGMRRRVAFISAIAPDPQVLLLDEPFSSVDEPTRIGIHQDVFRITKLMSTTSLLVTHDLAEAITLCDRVIILSKRPAVVAHEHTIPFGSEREMLALRGTNEYLRIYGELWNDLSEEISAKGGPR